MRQLKILAKLQKQSIEVDQNENKTIEDLMLQLKLLNFLGEGKKITDYEVSNMLNARLALGDKIIKVVINPIDERHLVKLCLGAGGSSIIPRSNVYININNSQIMQGGEQVINQTDSQVSKFVLKFIKGVRDRDKTLIANVLNSPKLNKILKQAFEILANLKGQNHMGELPKQKQLAQLSKVLQFFRQGQLQMSQSILNPILKDPQLHPDFKKSIEELFIFINQQNQQHSKLMDDTMFYKQVIINIKNGDNKKNEDIYLKHNNVAEDKMKIVKDCFDRVAVYMSYIKKEPQVVRECQKCVELKFNLKIANGRIKQIQRINQIQLEKHQKLQQQFSRQQQNNSDNKHIKSDLDNLNKQIHQLYVTKKKYSLIIDQLKPKNKQILQKCETLKTELEQARSTVNDKDRQIIQISQQLKQLRSTFNDKDRQIIQISQQLKQLNESNGNFSIRLQQLKHNKVNPLLVDQSSVLEYLRSNYPLSDQFTKMMKGELNRQIKKILPLYKFNGGRNENFHKYVDGKIDLILLCVTQEGRIVGGYSSVALSALSIKPQNKNIKSFIFSITDNSTKIFKLKPNKLALPYDFDFLIFGSQQLCIENNTCELNSYLVKGVSKTLHYYGSEADRLAFLSQGKDSVVKLRSYQILQVKFQ